MQRNLRMIPKCVEIFKYVLSVARFETWDNYANNSSIAQVVQGLLQMCITRANIVAH